MPQLIRKKSHTPKSLSLREFHEKHNKILIWHEKGGLGDVLMQRMMIDDFQRTMPEAEIVFACLPEYLDAAKDHPHVTKVLDSRHINPNDYVICYNTCVTMADRYENYLAPNCTDHRSDIWARSCGVKLENHDMRINLSSTLIQTGRERLERLRKPGTPLVAFAPVSKMLTKTLLPHQLKAVVDVTKDYTLFGLHTQEIQELTALGVPGIYKSTILEWMSYINAADYVISVDTAAFHLAGGLKKPLVGIFTFADGKAYGKYFDFVLVQKHRDNGDWACGPCFKFGDCPKSRTQPKPCLTEISACELESGIRQMFQRWPWGKNLPVLV